MKKQYMYKSKIKSQYGVETLVLCRDKNKLIAELQSDKYADFAVGCIEKSNRHFVTDGNMEIHYKPINC